jgi:peptidoglycan-associated lipoprotein
MSKTIYALSCLSLLLGCKHQAPATVAVSDVRAPPAEPTEPTLEASADETGTIVLSEEIRSTCGIADADAYFAFDSARIDPTAKGVLGQVATCFDSGPLAGRQMTLVGRADPRGEGAYNMALGDRRASAVSSALEGLGLRSRQMNASSRGEMDATGTSEASWASDRRVDVALAPR